MSKMHFEVFHATSKSNANDIIKGKFKVSMNRDDHWLGYGIYFFEHKIDAISWSTGTRYCKNDPAIIQCKLEFEKEKYLNLDNPEKYNEFIDYTSKALNTLSENNKSLTFENKRKYMCWGLNLYKMNYNIDLVKYTFSNSRTMTQMGYKFNKDYNYNYNEVQLCATNNKIIVEKTLS